MLSPFFLGLALWFAPAPSAAAIPAIAAPDSVACRVNPETGERACCRVCSTGKACGDSCIARNRNCRRGAGCACNAGETTRRTALATPAADADETREVQRQLARLGYYDGPVDGIAGPLLRNAVRAFQRAEGLEPDGVAGPVTRARLRERA